MENSKEIMKEVEAKKVLDNLNEKYELEKLSELIKDNKIQFKHEDKEYRVRLMSSLDKEELDDFRRKKFSQLLKDPDVLFEKKLIECYKEKGININEIDEEITKYTSEKINKELKLGEALSKNSGDAILKTYKEEITNLNAKINILIIQKSDLLAYSFENQLLNYVAKCISYLSFDIFENNDWKRTFSTLEEFSKYKDEVLIGKATKYALILQYC